MDFAENHTDKKRRRNLESFPMVYGKIPPQAKELEEVVLGALMLDVNCVFVGMSRLFPEIFYIDAHSKVFKAIQQIYDANKRIDILTVVEELKKNEELELVGGAYFVTQLTNKVVSGAHIENHINIISEMYLKREAISLSGELINEAYEDSSDAFDIVNKADYSFQKIQEKIIGGNVKDIAHYGMKVLEQHANTKLSGVLGIPTKLKTLDKVISGLVSPDFIIIAARPAQGKTALMLSITRNTSVIDKIPCAWFSLEMDGTQLVRRLASIDANIEHEKIRKGYTTSEEDFRLGASIDKISSCPIFIEDKSSINVRDIRTRSNILKKKHGIKYIVVDYLQLMKGLDTKNKNRENIISEISRSLKELAKELEIPVIALSQLNREVEKRPDKMPQLSDLRESGGIEADADEVIFLMRPEYYHMENSVDIGGIEYSPKGLCIASISKNRHGATKNIALQFVGEYMHFTNHPQNETNSQPIRETNLPYNDNTDKYLPF